MNVVDKRMIVIDGVPLPSVLDERMIHDVVHGFYDKIRADDLRESLRKQRTENERLQERVDVLIKAKELEEKQRKEVESRLRTALRIQARQQGGF